MGLFSGLMLGELLAVSVHVNDFHSAGLELFGSIQPPLFESRDIIGPRIWAFESEHFTAGVAAQNMRAADCVEESLGAYYGGSEILLLARE